MIAYGSMLQSFWWAWNIGLGLSSASSLMQSEGTLHYVFMFLWLSSTFIIIIILLNMLIAIMGDTFSKQSTISELLLIKDHLHFIIDNWYLNSLAIKDRDQIQYLFVAFNAANND
jgi:hypothetical protein